MANPTAGLQVQFTDGDRLHVHAHCDISPLTGVDSQNWEKYASVISCYKPGITSLSSIRGRSNLKLQEKMEYDMIYALRANFWYDMYIILHTIKVVITREGAR
jgi:lipopolysaccharide/colanic/teichoic acid biosynthesis glycosyltransferase